MTRSADRGLRRAAWASVLVLLFQAIAIIAAPVVLAQVSGHVIDCDDQSGNDTETNAAGDDETYTCLVTSGGNPVNEANVDVENLGTANDPDAGAVGDPDFDDGCVTGTNGTCQFVLAGADGVSGTANVCFWSDTGDDNEFSTAGNVEEDGGLCDAENAAAEGDGNGTDVVEKIWAAAPATATILDCDDESGDDAQTNNVGESELYTCLATAPDSGDAGTDPDPVSGVLIDWENLNGANDADNSSAAGAPDANNACTTTAQGLCTISIASSEGQAGAATICFWADTDNDNVFDPAGAADNDGGGCNSETAATENSDLIDTVTKTWVGITPDGIDCDDESGDDAETNQGGVSETYTCTVTAPDGTDSGTVRDPAPGVRIDWENLNGANDPDNSSNNATPDGNDACTTNASGVCTIVIAPSENATGAATICFWADTDIDAVFDQNGATNDGGGCNQETAATEDTDLIDTVTKTWTITVDILDCDDQSGDDEQSNNPGESEVYTCTATSPDSADAGSDRDPVSGIRIDWENLNGVNDPDNSSGAGAPDANDACTTGTAGTCTITIAATEAQTGTATICFWADTDNDNIFDPVAAATNDGGGCNTETAATEDSDLIDTVTKTWTAAVARLIDCTPETTDREITSTHTVTCTVTNVSGAPVTGVGVTFTETGAGDLTSPTTATTDANGRVTVTASSSATGTQQITSTLTEDLGSGEPAQVDECDRAAGDPSGAPAGDCDDTVDVVWEQRVRCLGESGEIIGTTGNDTITGTNGDDVICAGAGNDVVNGLGGDDVILLQGGADRASGGTGNDDILGGAGNDIITGNSGDDILRGQGGSDTLRGGDGRDVLLGGDGSDELRGGGGADDLRGGGGNDQLFGAGGNDLLNGGRGRDLCRGGRGRDVSRNCERR